MKRFHVHVAVPDLAAGIRFYSTLFGAEPSVTKDDYASAPATPTVKAALPKTRSTVCRR
jgi:catechol 2,3-dioxygenase-like lactoylglutathione lyase family enzyme